MVWNETVAFPKEHSSTAWFRVPGAVLQSEDTAVKEADVSLAPGLTAAGPALAGLSSGVTPASPCPSSPRREKVEPLAARSCVLGVLLMRWGLRSREWWGVAMTCVASQGSVSSGADPAVPGACPVLARVPEASTASPAHRHTVETWKTVIPVTLLTSPALDRVLAGNVDYDMFSWLF